jgi:hypothetical protein
MSSAGTLCPRLYFIVYLSCKRKNSARPFCYGTGSENRLDGIQNFGRFGSVFCKTVSDPSDGFPHTPSVCVASVQQSITTCCGDRLNVSRLLPLDTEGDASDATLRRHSAARDPRHYSSCMYKRRNHSEDAS